MLGVGNCDELGVIAGSVSADGVPPRVLPVVRAGEPKVSPGRPDVEVSGAVTICSFGD